MTLPAGWTARRPTLDDAPAILAVVHAADTFALGYPDFSLDDVRESLTAACTDPARDCWLASDPDGTVVAWATVDNPTGTGREFVEVYVDPQRGGPAQGPLLDRQLARVARRAGERGLSALTVRCAVLPPETRWRGLLHDAGFTFVKRYVRMSRSLAGLAPEPPPPPPGVTVRPVRPDDDADLRNFHRIHDTAFRDTPDHEPTGFDQWYAEATGRRDVAWDEWFVAEVDGVPAGVLRSSDQALEQDMGFVKHLAVLSGHRRRGVGTALLHHAFARYAAKGRGYAGLGVDLSNPTEAVHLYRSVGLSEVHSVQMYERQVNAM